MPNEFEGRHIDFIAATILAVFLEFVWIGGLVGGIIMSRHWWQIVMMVVLFLGITLATLIAWGRDAFNAR